MIYWFGHLKIRSLMLHEIFCIFRTIIISLIWNFFVIWQGYGLLFYPFRDSDNQRAQLLSKKLFLWTLPIDFIVTAVYRVARYNLSTHLWPLISQFAMNFSAVEFYQRLSWLSRYFYYGLSWQRRLVHLLIFIVFCKVDMRWNW